MTARMKLALCILALALAANAYFDTIKEIF